MRKKVKRGKLLRDRGQEERDLARLAETERLRRAAGPRKRSTERAPRP